MLRVSILALFATVTAFSATAMQAEIDVNGDGQASLTEIQLVYPDVTEDLFIEMDLDEDGFINDEEMAAAIDTNILVDSDS